MLLLLLLPGLLFCPQVYVYEGPDADYANFLQSLHCMVRHTAAAQDYAWG
jgi:hypothetical protein